MQRSSLAVLIVLLGVALSGSSCTDHNDDQATQQAAPGARGGYDMIPQQQIQPRVQSLPHR